MPSFPECKPRTVDLFAAETVYVVGLGRSGLATAAALRAGGAEVLCWDDHEAARLNAQKRGFSLSDPGRDGELLKKAKALVLSPGIPLTHPEPHPAVIAAKQANIPVIGDIELLFRSDTDACFIGITGTNGKSTTTALIGHILEQAGLNIAVGGNLGIPALSLPKAEIYVLEMSSYQLDLTHSPVFDIAILLNITPDHLDRHGGLAGYCAAKQRIFRPKTCQSLAIIGTATRESAWIAKLLASEGRDVQILQNVLARVSPLIEGGDCPALAGNHNQENAAAAYSVARALGLEDEIIQNALKSFPGLAHRQERIATLDGVTYINDSKATNADACAKALSAYQGIYWIAGGKAKEGGYDVLTPNIANVRGAFLIGEAAEELAEWLGDRVPVTLSGTLSQALRDATQAARLDDRHGPVLLSPACASFDQFESFEARGDAFREMVLSFPAHTRHIHSNREAA